MSTAVVRMQGSAASEGKRPSDESKVTVSDHIKGQLPELKSSLNGIDQSKPLPTSLQSDFLPEDLLFALTQSPIVREKLRPSRNLNTSISQSRHAPDNVWNYKRKEKFKHLTENSPCICGAGRDISFLYDVPQTDDVSEKPEKNDKSLIRRDTDQKPKQPLKLPDTLVPNEYHIVKNKGVLGIEYYDDKYTMQPEDHEKHLVVFPSMKPGSRFEVVQLKNALDEMLDKIGVNDLEVETRGPTQMHNLLELIKKEQNIYNVVFHELIRQVSVECAERGALLSSLRQRYSGLLNKVPQQIKSLHEEVMAQRALDRRLTEELMRFRTTISILTSELADVKEHDQKVTKEAQTAQEDLKSALAEAQKNTSLLAEYHDLYELQRHRLESQVTMLSEEKELWSTAAYSLALKVTEECLLTTAKRLHLSEQSWAKLANHFTVLLSDRDTELLTAIQSHIDHWRDTIDDFNVSVKRREDNTKDQIKGIKASIERSIKEFQNDFYNEEGTMVRTPDIEQVKEILADIRGWEEILTRETDAFGGDVVLSNQEELMKIRKEMEGWTDNALKVFGRHRGLDGNVHFEQKNMVELNEEVEELLQQYHNRVTGENGLVTSIIFMVNNIDYWDAKIAGYLNGVTPLHDSEWGGFFNALEDWLVSLDQIKEYVGSTQQIELLREGLPHTRIDIYDTVRKAQKWASNASNAIDSEDGKLVEQVATLHSEMVNWMVKMLLRLAPDKEGNSKEAAEMALLGSTTIPLLHESAKTLFEHLESFTNYVTLCCNGIVVQNTQMRKDNMEENADHELKDLHRLRSEFSDWISTAQMLMSQLTGEPVNELFPIRVPTASSESTITKRPDSGKSRTLTSRESALSTDSRESTPKDAQQRAASPQKSAQTPDVAVEVVQPNQDLMTQMEADTKATSEAAVSEEPQVVAGTEVTTEAQVTTEPEIKTEPIITVSSESKEKVVDKAQETAKEEKHVTIQEPKETVELIGQDDNTHLQKLQAQSTTKPPSDAEQPRVATPDTRRAFEALAAVESLQTQLIMTEERAQKAEEQVAVFEMELNKTQEKLRALEKDKEKGVAEESLLVVSERSPSPNRSATGARSGSAVKKLSAKQKPQKGKKK